MSQEAGLVAPPLRRSWIAPFAALVIGLVVGAGGATLTWTLTNDTDPAAGFDGDVATACSLVQRSPWTDKSAKSAEDFGRWVAATTLARNAAIADSQYKPLAEALETSGQIYSETYRGEGPEFEEHVRKARDFCATL